jgi:hypothetical protein
MADRRREKRSPFVQSLESRKLLSEISVAAFGATPNDGLDHSAQIQAAINASAPGDTIVFPSGTYNIGTSINPLGGGRTLQGNGAVLQTTSDSAAIHFTGSGLTVSGFTFVGRGIFADAPNNQMVENLNVVSNTFQVTHGNGVEFTTGLRNSTISQNRFSTSGGGDNGVYGYYWDNLNIADNSFVNGNEGIHVVDHGDSSRNLVIQRNYFANLHRMGVEYQGGGWDTVVQDNYYENPVMSAKFEDNNSTFAYSIIADESHNTIVRRNTAIAPERPDGTGVRIMFEIGGDNTLVEENYAIGGWHVLAGNDFNGTTSTLVRNNLWYGYLDGPGGAGLTLENNGPNVGLDWDINRPIPGAGVEPGMMGMMASMASLSSSVPEPGPFAVAALTAAMLLRRPDGRDELTRNKKPQAREA